MKRRWHWLLMSLRWLLVPLLPVLGLIVGVWLKPEMKPRWEYSSDTKIECAGAVADEEATTLIIFQSQLNDMRISQGAIVGLDIATGREVTRTNITLNEDHQFIAGTTFFVQPDNLFAIRSAEVCDWKSNRRLALLFNTNLFLGHDPFIFRNNVFAAYVRLSDKIAFWRMDDEEVHQSAFVIGGFLVHDIQLSASGEWAVASYLSYDDKNPTSSFQKKVQLIDTKSGKRVQTLPTDIELVRWHPSDPSFLALRYNAKTNTQYWQRYALVEGNSITPTGSPLPVSDQVQNVKQTPSPFIVLSSLNLENPWRIKLSSYLGKWGEEFLIRCWPASTTLLLYHSVTGELLNSLTLPGIINNLSKRQTTIHPDPSGKGLIIESLDHLTYWEFHPASRWYPWIGLCLGAVLSILVARGNLRGRLQVIPSSPNP